MRNVIVRLIPVLALSALALSAVQCSGTVSPGSSGATLSPTSATVGATGGTVSSSDKALDVVIPAGALPSNVTITVTAATQAVSGAVGTVYEIGPTGTTFTKPVTMTIHYAGVDLGGHDAKTLRVATLVGGAAKALVSLARDTTAQTVSGTTMHLSPYFLSAASAVCVSVGESTACAAPDTGSSGGGTPTCDPGPTCATVTGLCAGYPGATFEGCVDQPYGVTGECCFAADTPVCSTVGMGAACASTGPSGGTGGGTCPAPPTCETASACSEGTTLQSCTNNASGFTATCCYPAGTIPPNQASPSTGVSGVGSSDPPPSGGGGTATADAGASTRSDAGS